MTVSREVILDLLPVYLAGEASAATRALVDDYLLQDAALAEQVRRQGVEAFPGVAPALSPELELQSLRRTRGLLFRLRWLCALATTFTALSLTSRFTLRDQRVTEFHLMITEYPAVFGTCMVLAIVCWAGYFTLRRRLRITAM
jgi:hypothetical protein